VTRRSVWAGLYAGLLFTVLGAVAWATGQPFIFPSLGPSAYVLAFDRRGERSRTYRVVGSHVIGAVVGLVSYLVFAEGVVLVGGLEPLSTDGLRLATSGVVSVAVTTWGMIATDAKHAPACATTLIVSLGLLSTVRKAATIVVSVVILVGVHWATLRLYERYVSTAAE